MLNQLKQKYSNLSSENVDELLRDLKNTSQDDLLCTRAFLKDAIDYFQSEANITSGKSILNKELFLIRIQLIAAYLLLIGENRGYEFMHNYLLLLSMLSHLVPKDSLGDKAIGCITNSVDSLGYSWADIQSGFSCDILVYKILNGKPGTSSSASASFSRKGTFWIGKEGIMVTPYTSADAGPFTNSISICDDKLVIATKDNRDERLKASDAQNVRAIETFVDNFCQCQSRCKAEKKETLKNYMEEDRMSVLVTGFNDDGDVMVRTIDPSYKQLSGKIKECELVVGLNVSDLSEYLVEGSCFVDAELLEKDSECCTFSILDSYLDYAEFQAKYAKRNNVVFEATAFNIYGKNSINWISDNGVGMISFYDPSVNVGDKKLLSIVNIKENANGFYINARIVDDYPMSENRSFDPESVLQYFTREYESLMRSYVQPKGYVLTSSLTDAGIRSLAIILGNTSGSNDSLERYRRLSISRILYALIDDVDSAACLQGRAAFLKNCILFARGETLAFPERDVQYVCEEHKSILSALLCIGSRERERKLFPILCQDSYDETTSKIARLVLAKNTALLAENDLGFTDVSLRQEVAPMLGVSDMVLDEEIADIPTGKYGKVERQFREYKSSYVFRSDAEGADFIKQGHDEVFQAVCGLLNANGGQVYIGVTNNGDPITDSNWGVSADIKWLQANYGKVNIIRRKSLGRNVPRVTDIDSFANFLSDEKKIYFKDSQLDNIIIEPTEDLDAICITVSPSEYEIAYLYDDFSHTVGQAFRRDGNRTMPMNETEKRKRLMKLKSIGKEIDFQVKIQEAIDRHKKIILKGYDSKTKTDRHLAPINFLYGGESIWSVDLDDCNKVCKQFRLSRADGVEILDETYPHGKLKEDSDIFRFTGERNIHIKLQLNTKAKNYLIEEYPECRKLNESELYQSGDYWILDTKISNVMGLRRFYMGLADMITILKTEDSSMILQNISDFTRENILTEIL